MSPELDGGMDAVDAVSADAADPVPINVPISALTRVPIPVPISDLRRVRWNHPRWSRKPLPPSPCRFPSAERPAASRRRIFPSCCRVNRFLNMVAARRRSHRRLQPRAAAPLRLVAPLNRPRSSMYRSVGMVAQSCQARRSRGIGAQRRQRAMANPLSQRRNRFLRRGSNPA